MTWIIIGTVLLAALIAVGVVMLVRRNAGPSGASRALRRLADLRGWHFSHPDGTAATYGLSGESMLRGADESPLDWRIKWHLRTKRSQDKEKTEFKCADVPLEAGWVFLDPKSLAGEIRARQRSGAHETPSTNAIVDGMPGKKCAWKEAQMHAREMQVGSPEFLAHFHVTSTAKESVVRRLLPQRMQKALLGLPNAGHISVRMGTEGVVIVSPAVYSTDRVEQIINAGEILVSSVAQEQTAQVFV